jgi:superfamily II DNA/RNA helicase
MVLYLNEKYNDLYRNKEEAKGKNQEVYVHHHESESMKQQAQFHASMEQKIMQLQQRLEEGASRDEKKWEELDTSYKKRFAQIEKRMETQEALLSKISRQLDNFRSILFERTHHIAEKIEKAWRRDKEKVGQ